MQASGIRSPRSGGVGRHSDAGRDAGWIALVRRLAPLVFTGLIYANCCSRRTDAVIATAPRAYTDLRPATLPVAAASQQRRASRRTLSSASRRRFLKRGRGRREAVYGAALSPDALWATRLLSNRGSAGPNLPLAFGVPRLTGTTAVCPAAPLCRFFAAPLPEGTLDGFCARTSRLPGRWLSLLGARF